MDFGITAVAACAFSAGAFAQYFRGRRQVEEAIIIAETATKDVQVAMLHYDRRASRSEPHVPGQGEML